MNKEGARQGCVNAKVKKIKQRILLVLEKTIK